MEDNSQKIRELQDEITTLKLNDGFHKRVFVLSTGVSIALITLCALCILAFCITTYLITGQQTKQIETILGADWSATVEEETTKHIYQDGVNGGILNYGDGNHNTTNMIKPEGE